jgi:DNA polymerase-3 subunit delta
MPFFAETRTVLVEDSGFFKNKCEELADYMKNLPDYLRLVFVESEVDKRNRMYKAVKDQGHIAEFKTCDEKTLMRWAAGILGKEGLRIRQSDMELLLSKTGTDMGNLRMELEKLIAYTMGKDIVTAQDIETICTTQTTNKIFDMVRAVTEKDQKKALDLYYDLLALKEPPMRILFLLSRQFKQLWEAKQLSGEGASQAEIASRVGVPAFAVRGLLSCARAYTSEELKMAVEDFIEAEEDVKTGRQNDVMSVELLIIKYSNPNNQ